MGVPIILVCGAGEVFKKGVRKMSCWNKEQLEQMLEDVVNALDLSDSMIDEHGQHGTPPAELVRLVLDRKDREIAMLKAGMVNF